MGERYETSVAVDHRLNGGDVESSLELMETTDIIPIGETGAVQKSLYSQYMGVAEYEDGTQAFVTFYSDTQGDDASGGDPTYAERAEAAAQFFENVGLGDMVPEHYFDREHGYLAVEAVDGYEVSEEYKYGWSGALNDAVVVDELGGVHMQRVPPAVADCVDRDAFDVYSAAHMVSGNSDMKGENTMVTADGTLHGIDLDHAGGDFTQLTPCHDGETTHYERGREFLKTTGQLLGFDVTAADIEQQTALFAQQVRDDIGIESALDGVQNSRLTDHMAFQYRDNIAKNIGAFADGNVPDT